MLDISEQATIIRSRSSRTFIARLLDRWEPSGWYVLGVAAILVGFTGGLGVWIFKQGIVLAQLGFGIVGAGLKPYGVWTVALVPAIGGLIVGLIIHHFVGIERHHGVAGIMESVALAGGRLRYWRIPAKTIASALSIGAGASVGPEDPSVQIGAGLGSMFGQWFHLSDDRVRVLVSAGVAAGISAAFNAPIAGVFFALELVLGEIGGSALGVVVLASVVSAVVTQAIAGPQPAFGIPSYTYHSAWELALYLGLGLLAGPVAALYVRLLYISQDAFHAWHAPEWIKPAIAGVLVGIVGIFLPQVFGVGYSTIEEILKGGLLTFGLMAALTIGKLICTPLSIGGGFPGGVFAPSLFIGATLGGAYGTVAQYLFPSLQIAPPAYAMVGMAAVLAGSVHAPLTAVLLLFEMTNDYRIILPLMFAVTVSLVLSQSFQSESVYTLGLKRKGVNIERGRDVEVLQSITVGEVMQTEIVTLHDTDTINAASDILLHLRSHGLPVVNSAGELCGIFTVQDIERANSEGNQQYSVGEICTHEVLVTYTDETLATALRRMSVRDIGRLPVVAHDNPRHIVGLLRRIDIIRAYDVALTRRAALRHRAHQVRLGAVGGVSVEEIAVEEQSLCVGQRVSEIAWPHDCVIATVRRGTRLLIPRGDTVLQAGDVLAVVAEGDALDTVYKICKNSAS